MGIIIVLYILIASGIIGALYLLYNRANNSEMTVRKYFEEKLMLVSGISPDIKGEPVTHSRYSNKGNNAICSFSCNRFSDVQLFYIEN